MNEHSISSLKKIISEFGNDINIVQGGGGNISVKTGQGMLIKASGFNFRSMMEKKAFVLIDHKRIKDAYLSQSSQILKNEDGARKLIKNSVIGGTLGMKPSLETAFHCYLGKFVIHVHPLFLDAILCTKDCENFLKEIFSDIDYVFIRYFQPGHTLAEEIAKKVKEQKSSNEKMKPSVFFLQNHGLIIEGDDIDRCIELTNEISVNAEKFVKERTNLKFQQYTPPIAGEDKGKKGFIGTECIPPENDGLYLTPDGVVYLSDLKDKKSHYSIVNGRMFYSLSEESSRNIDEVIYAQKMIFMITKKLGGINPLQDSAVDNISDMEEEKHRQSLLKE